MRHSELHDPLAIVCRHCAPTSGYTGCTYLWIANDGEIHTYEMIGNTHPLEGLMNTTCWRHIDGHLTVMQLFCSPSDCVQCIIIFPNFFSVCVCVCVCWRGRSLAILVHISFYSTVELQQPIYNTYSTSQSTIWENILRARKIFSRAKGE